MKKSRKTLTIAAILIPIFIVTVLLSTISYTNYQQMVDLEKEISLVDQAKRELELKNYKKTETLLLQALAITPEDKDTIILLDKVYRLQNKFEESTKFLEEHKNIRDNRIFNQLADNYLKKQDYETALANADLALSLNPRDSVAFILKMKIYNLTLNKDDAQKTILNFDELYFDSEAKFYRYATLMNFGSDASSSLELVKLNLPSDYQELVTVYKINFPNIANPDTELEAKANIVYALIKLDLFELAFPFSQDMAGLNRFYENSLIYRAIVNVNTGNPDSAQEDLNLLEKYYPNRYLTKILSYQVAIVKNDKEQMKSMLANLEKAYKPEYQELFFEAIKFTFNSSNYENVYEVLTKMGPQLSIFESETNYMLLKSSVYLNKISGLEDLVAKIFTKLEVLSPAQQAEVYAVKALIANKNKDTEGVKTFIQQALSLNTYSSFVHYVNWTINKDPAELFRAKELDANKELPENV